MDTRPDPSPVNPLPPVVIALFLLILGVELMFTLGARGIVGGPSAVGWRLQAIQEYGFSAEVLKWMWQTGRWPLEHLFRLLSYPFVHGSFTNALFAGVILLAMGKMAAESFGQLAALAIFVLSGIGGALIYTLVVPGATWLIGAYPPVYGLIGAFTFMLWVSLSRVGANQARAFQLIGFLMGIQLLFGLFFGTDNSWVADLAGFGVGFALSFVLSPGGWSRLLARLRQD